MLFSELPWYALHVKFLFNEIKTKSLKEDENGFFYRNKSDVFLPYILNVEKNSIRLDNLIDRGIGNIQENQHVLSYFQIQNYFSKKLKLIRVQTDLIDDADISSISGRPYLNILMVNIF